MKNFTAYISSPDIVIVIRYDMGGACGMYGEGRGVEDK